MYAELRSTKFAIMTLPQTQENPIQGMTGTIGGAINMSNMKPDVDRSRLHFIQGNHHAK